VNIKVAINACGLHVGGGVQVAVSFIDELSRLDILDLDIHIFVSTEVDVNLFKISSKIRNTKNYKVLDTYGLNSFFSSLNKELKQFALVFSVFGPSYLRQNGNIEIMGFAQPWIIDTSAYKKLTLKARIKSRAKFFIQSLFFRRAKKLVVELEHVKAGLIKKGIAKSQDIEIVHNCISSTYLDRTQWEALPRKISKQRFSIGFLGRDYPHKNTTILPAIKSVLQKKHGLDVDFFVTFNEIEWRTKPHSFKSQIINIGTLSVAQCPCFYQFLDAVIFPSVLECFSATPLEAMAMKKPLFASDRGFVRDICGDFALYFDPFNEESAADVIAEYIKNRKGIDGARLAAAREHVLKFSSARGRAERYLEIIRNTLAEQASKNSN